MATVTKAQHAMLTNISEGQRDMLAISVLKGRLGFAIRVGRTDSLALAKARQLAEKYGWPIYPKTMKQALHFVEAAHDAWRS